MVFLRRKQNISTDGASYPAAESVSIESQFEHGMNLNGDSYFQRYRTPAMGFARQLTGIDVKLLAQTDALHDIPF
jgi:hypothetical protein